MSRQPLKILHLYNGGKLGGVQTLFQETVRGLHRRGVEQQLVLGLDEPAPHPDIHYIRTPFRNRFRDICTHYKIWRICRKFRPDILQVWPHRASWFTPKYSNNLPIVMYIGGPISSRRFYKFYAKSDAILVPAQPTAASLKEFKGINTRIEVLRHFVPEKPSGPATPLPSKPNAPIIVAAGRFSHEKGFDVLIKAVKQIPSAHLWLAGTGAEQETLEQLVDQYHLKKQVTFLGWLPSLTEILQQADICVIPSRKESFGLVILEAWQQAVPVIATQTEGPSTLIQQAENGLLVPIDDVKAMVNGITTLLHYQVLAKTYGKAGQQTYLENYTEAQAMQELLEFYREILNA